MIAAACRDHCILYLPGYAPECQTAPTFFCSLNNVLPLSQVPQPQLPWSALLAPILLPYSIIYKCLVQPIAAPVGLIIYLSLAGLYLATCLLQCRFQPLQHHWYVRALFSLVATAFMALDILLGRTATPEAWPVSIRSVTLVLAIALWADLEAAATVAGRALRRCLSHAPPPPLPPRVLVQGRSYIRSVLQVVFLVLCLLPLGGGLHMPAPGTQPPARAQNGVLEALVQAALVAGVAVLGAAAQGLLLWLLERECVHPVRHGLQQLDEHRMNSSMCILNMMTVPVTAPMDSPPPEFGSELRPRQQQQLLAAPPSDANASNPLAMLNHELRTPLAEVLGLADLLRTESSGELLDMLQSACQTVLGHVVALTRFIELVCALAARPAPNRHQPPTANRHQP